ncbi:hypothetical protein CJU90_3463 [Yarrowia sp. C11]|nr:hypothetical protein CKK34_4909 [Yarrowia sp. E02]KAG5369923.1 hypothetical protein CJU90_3463 [Yarrowia sp. C11]
MSLVNLKLHQLLETSPYSTQEQIDQAFLNKTLYSLHHLGSLSAVSYAYQILRDPQTRELYNNTGDSVLAGLKEGTEHPVTFVESCFAAFQESEFLGQVPIFQLLVECRDSHFESRFKLPFKKNKTDKTYPLDAALVTEVLKSFYPASSHQQLLLDSQLNGTTKDIQKQVEWYTQLLMVDLDGDSDEIKTDKTWHKCRKAGMPSFGFSEKFVANIQTKLDDVLQNKRAFTADLMRATGYSLAYEAEYYRRHWLRAFFYYVGEKGEATYGIKRGLSRIERCASYWKRAKISEADEVNMVYTWAFYSSFKHTFDHASQIVNTVLKSFNKIKSSPTLHVQLSYRMWEIGAHMYQAAGIADFGVTNPMIASTVAKTAYIEYFFANRALPSDLKPFDYNFFTSEFDGRFVIDTVLKAGKMEARSAGNFGRNQNTQSSSGINFGEDQSPAKTTSNNDFADDPPPFDDNKSGFFGFKGGKN